MKIDINQVFSSLAEAQVFRQETLHQYAPQGYGTYLTITEHVIEHEGDQKTVYIVEGYRYSSCD